MRIDVSLCWVDHNVWLECGDLEMPGGDAYMDFDTGQCAIHIQQSYQ